MLFRTSFSDPGVIPRASQDQAKQIERQETELKLFWILQKFQIGISRIFLENSVRFGFTTYFDRSVFGTVIYREYSCGPIIVSWNNDYGILFKEYGLSGKTK